MEEYENLELKEGGREERERRENRKFPIPKNLSLGYQSSGPLLNSANSESKMPKLIL